MTDLPEPLTPAECDLRDFPFMPLDVARLRDSDLASLPDPEARWANVMAWSASWHQVPAASLPDNDAMLCRLLGYGRDLKTWAKVRAAGGLRGWVKCSDGRLYHPVVAEKALEAWGKKVVQRKRSKAGNDARWGRTGGDGHEPAGGKTGKAEQPSPSFCSVGDVPKGSLEDAQSIPQGVPQGSQGTGTGTGTGIETDPPSLRSGGARAAKARATRLPADWQPSPSDAEFARKVGLDPEHVAECFRDYWAARPDGAKLDWSATWRIWCRRDAKEAAARAPKPRGGGFEALAERYAREDEARRGFDSPDDYLASIEVGHVH